MEDDRPVEPNAQDEWPPEFVRLPIALLTARDARGQRLPAEALETWLDFRALAWGRRETLELEFDMLRAKTGKARSTLCKHLALLTRWFGLRWQTRGGRVQVFFAEDPDPASEKLDGAVRENLKDSHLDLKDSLVAISESRFPEARLPEPSPAEAGSPAPRARPRRNRADPRTAHRAVQACRAITGHYPDKAIYDKLIAALGEAPDLDRMRRCRLEWVERGYNPASWKWATEWYAAGIPEQRHKGGQAHEAGITGRGNSAAENEPAPSALAKRLAGREAR